MAQSKQTKTSPFIGTWIYRNPYMSEVRFTITENTTGINVNARDLRNRETAEISDLSIDSEHLSFIAHWPRTGRVTKNRLEPASTNCLTLSFSYTEQANLVRRTEGRPLLQVFGDSIACGVGASDRSKSWVELSAYASVCCAKPGATAAGLAIELLAFSPDIDRQCALMIGTNNVCGASRPDDSVKQATVDFDLLQEAKERLFKSSLLQCLIYLLKPQDLGMTAVSCTGRWGDVNIGAFGSNISSIGKGSNVQGSTATVNVSGTAVYIGYIVQAACFATADVLIDGIKVGSLSSSGHTASSNTEWAPVTARFGGLRPGDHTVEVVITSPHGQSFCISHITASEHSKAPRILVSNIIRMDPPAYSRVSASDQAVDRYNDIITNVVDDLTTDGFDVRLIDNHSNIDPATDLAPDGIHPNDRGHRKIYEQFDATMREIALREGGWT